MHLYGTPLTSPTSRTVRFVAQADKYELPPGEADAMAAFLAPMLDFVPERRATAAQMLLHPWLEEVA